MIPITKSMPEPSCLAHERTKASGDYRCGDVLDRNKRDFFNKCYICGFKHPTSLNTEHFIAHLGDPDLKFDWKNLFLSCAHCNMTKGANSAFNHILNCTDPSHSVETAILYEAKLWPKEDPKFIALNSSPKTLNTVTLLETVFSGKTKTKALESDNLRTSLLAEMNKFQKLVLEYVDYCETDDEPELKRRIIRELHISTSFASFKRWAIRSNDWLRSRFESSL